MLYPLIAVRVALRRLGVIDADDDDGDGDGDGEGGGSFWRGIPRRQWGRFVEVGGMTVDEQSESVRDVQRQAEAYEDVDPRYD